MSPVNIVGGSAAAASADDGTSGRLLIGGRYARGETIGRGAEGETFAAVDRLSGQPVALKYFQRSGPAAMSRVAWEFEKLVGMAHPGVVRALDLGRHDGRLFLVTELLEGESIASIAAIADEERRRATFERAARQLVDALAYLHARGVTHGDVSPQNVRLTSDGRAVLIDLAGFRGPGGGAGREEGGQPSGGAVGTLGFAAPEALIGRCAPASDLFSLGATLFTAWAGSAPFGDGVASVARMLAGPAPTLSSVRGGLGAPWDDLLGGLLRAAPEQRFSSARSVLQLIGRLVPEGERASQETAHGDGAGQATLLPPHLLPPHPAGDPLAGIFVGRASERAVLQQTFELLAEGVSPHAVIALVGCEGAGRRSLMEVALRDLAISRVAESAPPVAIFRGPVAALGGWLGGTRPPRTLVRDDDPARARQVFFATLAVALDVRAEELPVLVALDPGPDEEALAAFLAGAPASGRWLVLVTTARPLQRVAARDLPLPPLLPAEIQSLVSRAAGEEPPAAAIVRVAAAGAGHAATVALLARQLVEAIRRGDAASFAPRSNLALQDLLSHSFEQLPPPARRLIAAAALALAPPSDEGASHFSDPSGEGASHFPSGEGASHFPSGGGASHFPSGGGASHFVDLGGAEEVARAAGWLLAPSEALGGSSREGGRDQAEHSVRFRLPTAVHAAVFRRHLAHPDVQGVARTALASATPLADGARGLCLEATGQTEAAAMAFLAAAAHESAGAGDPHANITGAARWLEEAARLVPACLDVDQRTTLATALALAGRGDEALSVLDLALSVDRAGPEHQGTLAGGGRLRLIERKAWLLSRAAALDSARQLLQETIAATPLETPAALLDPVRARLARVLVSLGRFDEAVTIAGLCAPDAAAGLLAREAAILAHAYAGDLVAARRLLAALPRPAAASATGPRALEPALAARSCYLAALVDHLAGDLQPALETYRCALAHADSCGDIHTAAAIALNMGALAAESGRYDEALSMQDRAIRELGRLGATTELATALFNAGMTLLEIGDPAGARTIMARLRRERAAAPVIYLEAELALRQGEESSALALFTRVTWAGGDAPGDADREPTARADDSATPGSAVATVASGPLARAAMIARAELLARAHRTTEAEAALDQLQASAADPRATAELRLARGKMVLAGPTLELAVALCLAAALAEDAAVAAGEGRRPRAWRTSLTAARLFHRAGQTAQASAQIVVARGLFQEVRMSIPVDHRSGIDQDADARLLNDLARLAAIGDNPAGSSRDGRGSRAEDRLRRLLRINKRLNSELRLPRLLELIMDTIIELTEAERGFILLEDEKGELTVKVARNIDQQTLETGAFDLSRSIARQAAAGGAPIVTIDAAGDPRFREALSVSDLHLRSVLAVPLQAKGRAVGTLYVDNRLRKGAFGDEDVQLVLDFAEQAGIAIENARLLSELRRRERQIEVLNRRLQGELALRKEELVGMKQELRENREALAIRYDYRNIIGRTPRMLELFRLLDRLTDTTLPVVIQGESGTGKELVARALHFNGPRRDRPFVSENCAAIPETLLESTLFGAVRGAYTGADHDTRGLFEVADGGTLFLDEVGEMSPGMQGKLLRVLQSGEMRRVGSERIRKVEVRVVAATNRDLGRLVEEGRFRQDLFFRLSVAPIALPPLRERREDIPAIVEHVLGKMTAGTPTGAAPTRLTPAAMARLVSYRWPGNVRELENELMRAAALSDGPIDVNDLSPHVAGNAETALTTLDDPDNLALRPRVERLERALLREALSRCGGNQTRAAVALGLSRFGLQKKMQRYQIG